LPCQAAQALPNAKPCQKGLLASLGGRPFGKAWPGQARSERHTFPSGRRLPQRCRRVGRGGRGAAAPLVRCCSRLSLCERTLRANSLRANSLGLFPRKAFRMPPTQGSASGPGKRRSSATVGAPHHDRGPNAHNRPCISCGNAHSVKWFFALHADLQDLPHAEHMSALRGASGFAKAATLPSGSGSSIPSPAGGLRVVGLSFIGLLGLISLLRYAALSNPAFRPLERSLLLLLRATHRDPGPRRSHHHHPSPGRPPASISTVPTRPFGRLRIVSALPLAVSPVCRLRAAPRAIKVAARVAARASGAAAAMTSAWAAAEAASWPSGWPVAAARARRFGRLSPAGRRKQQPSSSSSTPLVRCCLQAAAQPPPSHPQEAPGCVAGPRQEGSQRSLRCARMPSGRFRLRKVVSWDRDLLI
jgi:hypothetical protein